VNRGAGSAALGLALAAAVGLPLAVRAQAVERGLAPRPAWLEGAPPDGWAEMAGLARTIATGLLQSAPFGALPGQAGAAAHVERGAGAFYLSWLEAERAGPAAAGAVRGALDRLRENRMVSSPEASSTEELRYAEEMADGLVEIELEWRHLSNESLSLMRGFAWLSSDGKPRLAVAECVVGTRDGAAAPAVEKSCRDALASVAVVVPPAQRGALTALPPGRAGAGAERFALGGGEPATGAAADPATSRPGSPRPPAVGPAGPGGRVLYRGPDAPDKDSTSEWFILLGAGLVIAALTITVRARRAQTAGRGDDDEPGSGPENP
jgi:hypothetical protein